jgi:hypothetical protein
VKSETHVILMDDKALMLEAIAALLGAHGVSSFGSSMRLRNNHGEGLIDLGPVAIGLPKYMGCT